MANKHHIFIIGFMNSGKTYIGNKLSTILNITHIDLDKYIEKKLSMSISNIFQKKGESFFRHLEIKFLYTLIKQYDNRIISLGGGTVQNKKILSYLKKNGLLIWLYSTPTDILQLYYSSDKKRPLLNKYNTLKKLLHLYSQRRKLYKHADLKMNKKKLKYLEGIETYVKTNF